MTASPGAPESPRPSTRARPSDSWPGSTPLTSAVPAPADAVRAGPQVDRAHDEAVAPRADVGQRAEPRVHVAAREGIEARDDVRRRRCALGAVEPGSERVAGSDRGARQDAGQEHAGGGRGGRPGAPPEARERARQGRRARPTSTPSRSSTTRVARSTQRTLVHHHDDGAPGPTASASTSITPAPAAASRLPVGSSANTTGGIHDQGPRDRDPLLLASREFRGKRPRAAARPRRSNSEPTRAEPLRFRRAERAAGRSPRGQLGDQTERLEHESDVLAAEAGALRLGALVEPAAGNGDGAAGRTVESGQQVQERRLAGAGGPDDGHELAHGDVEVDAVQHGAGRVAGAVDAHEAARRHDRARHRTKGKAPGGPAVTPDRR